MKTIVKTLFGSNLYGTATPTSDTDYKSVHLPSGQDLLLLRTRNVVSTKTKADTSIKNDAQDVDDESFALHTFFNMLEKGESIALEVLFAPPQNIIEYDDRWYEILAYRHRLLTKNCKGFVSYCQRQAAKYGIRGSRVATVRTAIDWVNSWISLLGASARVGDRAELIEAFVAEHEWSNIEEIEQVDGRLLKHWVVCDRKLPYTIRLSEAKKILDSVFAQYGQRALAAEQNQGIDWKAVSHAVRVGQQAIELLTTGHLTFPRPNAVGLLEIKQGLVPYDQVSGYLENLLALVEQVSAESKLPETVDRDLMNSILEDWYGQQVIKHREPVGEKHAQV